MALLRFIRRLIAGFACLYLLTLAFVVGFAALQPLWEPIDPKADLIVVLGGGISGDGTLHRSTSVRVDRGVQLFLDGAADKILFTGGSAFTGAPSNGAQMALRALAQGVPQSAILTEEYSQSTLQNALFSRADWANANHIILVTEGFHLPRSWASFKVMGAGKIALVHARKFRGDNIAGGMRMVIRESLAYWFNAARFTVWKASSLTPLSQTDRDALLY
nr:YdcF family protein [Amylibacter sp.]